MPWTPSEFASRHNHKLSGEAASTAARMATAMVNRGVPEGIAIATANKHGDKMMSHQHRQDGGGTFGGMTPYYDPLLGMQQPNPPPFNFGGLQLPPLNIAYPDIARMGPPPVPQGPISSNPNDRVTQPSPSAPVGPISSNPNDMVTPPPPAAPTPTPLPAPQQTGAAIAPVATPLPVPAPTSAPPPAPATSGMGMGAFGGTAMARGGMVQSDPLGKLAHPMAVKGIGGGGAGAAPKTMSPSQGTPWWTRSAGRELDKPAASGIGHFQFGGISMSEASPWTERADARTISDIPMHGGLIGGSGAGRTDRLPLSVANNSHVVPADVVSALGQGTTAHGGKILEGALGGGTGPYGTPIPHEIRGHGPPAPPHVSQSMLNQKHGGHTHEKTSILAASGEFVVPPEWVEALGHRGIAAGKCKKNESAMDCGHRLIDEMIHNVRDFQIKWLRTAPPPKKKDGGPVGIGLAA